MMSLIMLNQWAACAAPNYEDHVDQLLMKEEMERGWFPDETGMSEDEA